MGKLCPICEDEPCYATPEIFACILGGQIDEYPKGGKFFAAGPECNTKFKTEIDAFNRDIMAEQGILFDFLCFVASKGEYNPRLMELVNEHLDYCYSSHVDFIERLRCQNTVNTGIGM